MVLGRARHRSRPYPSRSLSTRKLFSCLLSHLSLPCFFRLRFHGNGRHRNWLAAVGREKIRYILLDNAFTAMDDRAAALTWADSWDPWFLHRKLEKFAHPYYPILKQVNEAAYASDSVFAGGPAGQSETGTGETRHHRRTGSSKINPEPPATIAWQHRQSLRIPTCHNSLYERS